MANIKPFRCLHPADGLAARVAALPYDVYNRKEAYAAAAKDRLSFLNIDRPETQFPEDADMYAPEVYEKARELLHQRIDEGVFVREKSAAYDVYELTMDGRSQTGLVACASIDDYVEGVIKKHENTRAEKEADRIRHVDVCSAQTGPIFLAYRRNAQIQEITARVKREAPLFSFTSEDGITHRGWRISAEDDIQAIREAFRGISAIYIADGHHRAASAVRVGLRRRAQHPDYDGSEEFNYFLSILFPDDELRIFDYNRVVKDLNGLTEEEFLSKVREKFTVRECKEANTAAAADRKAAEAAAGESECRFSAVRPKRKGCMAMYLNDTWYHLTVRDEFCSDDPVKGLDVSILQNELLSPVLGIGDPKEDARIDFVGGIRGIAELERRVHTDCAVAFAMYPTSIEELFAVADAGLLMPPKSTWFEPKLRSGLFIHEIEE